MEMRRLLSSTLVPYDVADFDNESTNVNGGVVADAEGNLYGVTTGGGADGQGAVFEIPPGTDTVNTLYSFTGGNDGSAPAGPLLINSAGDLFGVSIRSAGVSGMVFELSGADHTFSTLAQLNVDNAGGSPTGGLVADTAGDLFGTTTTDEFTNDGNVYEVSAVGHAARLLGVPNVGSRGVSISSNGTLFGVTSYTGLYSKGTVFSIAPDGGRYDHVTTLAEFGATEFFNPIYPPLVEPDGTLVGTDGEDNGYELLPGASTPVAYNLTSSEPLTIDSAGDLFGTAIGEITERPAGSTYASSLSLGDNSIATLNGPVLVENGTFYDTEEGTYAAGGGAVIQLAPASALGASSITLTAAPTQVHEGQSTTLTATVTPAGAVGNVNFTLYYPLEDGEVQTIDLGTAALASDGTASIQTSNDSGYPITAQYEGDRTLAASTSVAITLTELQQITTPQITLTDSFPTSTGLSPAVTFTAEVASTNPTLAERPTGSVTFYVNGNDFSEVAMNADGTATLQTSSLPQGVDEVTAVYDGDSNFLTVTSDPVSVVSYSPGVYVSHAGLKEDKADSDVAGTDLKGRLKVQLSTVVDSVAHGPVAIRVYLSTDATLDGSDELLGSLDHRVNLKSGVSIYLTVPVNGTLPDVTSRFALYHLLVQVTGSATRSNVTDLGPVIEVEPQSIQLTADVVAPVTLEKSQLQVLIYLTDDGNVPASGNATIALSFYESSGTLVATFPSAVRPVRLRPYKKFSVRVRVTLPPNLAPILYRLQAVISLLSTTATAGAGVQVFN